ncbi:hypothetical protein [Saliphagus sp. LR7]|uniref:DUF7567 family protein n=1 Tax=Saliphagus sp. LR7 TaxID=2282654 RepID=UPI000DF7E08D|nr:hypothetical protein [Saliphagus sp. LR7]
MGIVETENRYNGAFDVVECPVCGSDEWTHIVYQGVFCANCNTKCTLREPAGDQGFIAEFDGAYTWSVDDGEKIPETEEYGPVASGKWLGTENTGYHRHWFSARADYVHDDCEWEPAWHREPKNENENEHSYPTSEK